MPTHQENKKTQSSGRWANFRQTAGASFFAAMILVICGSAVTMILAPDPETVQHLPGGTALSAILKWIAVAIVVYPFAFIALLALRNVMGGMPRVLQDLKRPPPLDSKR
jgi:hypothetical protein